MVVSAPLTDLPQDISPVVADLVTSFHKRTPIRTWSLIVTLYGDAIVPRGGTLWLGSLITVMEAFGIAPGIVRTAGSRLAADDWLQRTRIGRKSFYRLSPRGRSAFAEATERIYNLSPGSWNGRFHLAVLGDAGDADRASLRRQLEEAGYGLLAPTVMIAPDGRVRPKLPMADTVELDAVAVSADDALRLAERAWPLKRIAKGYQRFCRQFGRLERAIDDREIFTPLESLLARILLIHEYRRIILRDPALPPRLLPADWPGTKARRMSGRIYRNLVKASEQWLDANAVCDDGPLPPPDTLFYERFAPAEASGQ